ncbi:hypothetical protein Barb7_00098 [Bacteroidales bacterium Barb7]|nr:hypothetical protein Barb7_00098 [Bacteroidales bacterium Barb7]
MQLWEVGMMMEGVYMKNRDVWEANRMTAYITAQVNSKKRLKPRSIIEFPWEKETLKNEIKVATDPDRLMFMKSVMEQIALDL